MIPKLEYERKKLEQQTVWFHTDNVQTFYSYDPDELSDHVMQLG